MADLFDVLNQGIAFANQFTINNRLQVKVTHRAASVSSGSGSVSLGAPVIRDAIVEFRQEEVRDAEGEGTKSRAVITFLDPTVSVGFEDSIVLHDGTTGPILAIEAPTGGGATGTRLLTSVYLG